MILLFIKHLFRVRLDPLIRKGIMSKDNNTCILGWHIIFCILYL